MNRREQETESPYLVLTAAWKFIIIGSVKSTQTEQEGHATS